MICVAETRLENLQRRFAFQVILGNGRTHKLRLVIIEAASRRTPQRDLGSLDYVYSPLIMQRAR